MNLLAARRNLRLMMNVRQLVLLSLVAVLAPSLAHAQSADLVLCDQPYAALDGADALVVVTEWKAFRSPDFERIRSALRTPVVFDGRNIFDPAAVESAGIAYYGIGRGRSVRAAAG